MFIKFVLLLFCCALINAKSLVQSDSRYDAFNNDIEKFERFPDIFDDLERLKENDEEGVIPHIQFVEDDKREDELEESFATEMDEVNEKTGENVKEEKGVVADKKKVEDNDEIYDEDDEEKTYENEEKEKEEKANSKEDEDGEKDEEDEKNEEKESKDVEQKEDDQNEQNNDDENDSESFKKRNSKKSTPNFKTANATVGIESPLSPTPVDFPTAEFNQFQRILQNPTINKHIDTITNLVDWQTLARNFPSLLEKFFTSEQSDVNFSELDDEKSLKQKIDDMEKNNANAEYTPNETGKPSPKIEFGWDDISLDPAVGNFILQAIPENIRNLQIPAKLQELTAMWMNNVNRHAKAPAQKEPKVGFGGWFKKQKASFGNLTSYVNKAVEQARTKLENNGRIIEVNNPPLTINVIPLTPITFKLKRVEGAHTIDKYGQSKVIHYNKLYANTQYKFNELRYYYDVIIKPLNLFDIRESITIILNDARTKMNLSVEKNEKIDILILEFVDPNLMVDCNTNRFTNYAVNYLLNDVHPVIKQKMVEIVSRDSKLVLENYLKDAQ